MASHSLVIACECGASLGMSPGVTDITEDMEHLVMEMWEEVHSGMGHERVTCAEARQIRTNFNRRYRSYGWAKRNPERVKEIQAKYRAKRRNGVIDNRERVMI